MPDDNEVAELPDHRDLKGVLMHHLNCHRLRLQLISSQPAVCCTIARYAYMLRARATLMIRRIAPRRLKCTFEQNAGGPWRVGIKYVSKRFDFRSAFVSSVHTFGLG